LKFWIGWEKIGSLGRDENRRQYHLEELEVNRTKKNKKTVSSGSEENKKEYSKELK
jgi:hypothetical protein